MFLRSVEANKGRVDLVFVAKRDESEAGGGRCVDLGETGNNIRSVCLSNFECELSSFFPSFSRVELIRNSFRVDWTLHQEYLCDRWKCNEQEKEELMEVLLHRGREDYVRFSTTCPSSLPSARLEMLSFAPSRYRSTLTSGF